MAPKAGGPQPSITSFFSAQPLPSPSPRSSSAGSHKSFGASPAAQKAGPKQLFLDFGQRNFSFTTCRTCGLLYAQGVAEDEKLHSVFHKGSVQGVTFQGWQEERVVQRLEGEGGRTVLVLPHDSHHHLAKVREVARLMECELGLPENWLITKNCKIYLFITSTKKVAGCLVSEPIKEAFALLPPERNSSGTQPEAAVEVGRSDITQESEIMCRSKTFQGASNQSGDIKRLSACSFRSPETQIELEDREVWGHGFEEIERSNVVEDSEKGSPVSSEGRRTSGEDEASSNAFGECEQKGKELRIEKREEKLIENVLVREVMGKRERVVLDGSRSEKDKGFPMVCFSAPLKAACGVRAVWVHRTERRKKIATQLLDTLRSTFAYGCVLLPSQIAFSQPTSDGRAFAAKYCGTEFFLVYR